MAHCGDSTRGEPQHPRCYRHRDGLDRNSCGEQRGPGPRAPAPKDIREALPFPLLGIDSDNRGEFINAEPLHYCERENLTVTRPRAYRKNDGCHAE